MKALSLQRVVDGVAELFPAWNLRRVEAKYRAEVLDDLRKRHAFRSAERNRLNENWLTPDVDLNAALRTGLRLIRNRSRWLTRNNPNAKAGLNSLRNYVVGTGLTLQAAVRRFESATDPETGLPEIREIPLDGWNDYAESIFSDWTRFTNINSHDANPIGFVDDQWFALQKWVEDGESFTRLRYRKQHPVVPFCLEHYEPEWLDEGIMKNPETDYPVDMGVEYHPELFFPTAYWFNTLDHRGYGYYQHRSLRIPADEIVHLFLPMAARQRRGVPFMHAVMERFFKLDDYAEAELTTQQIAACFGAILTLPADVDPDKVGLKQEGNQRGLTDAEGNTILSMEPGMVAVAPHGYGVSFAQPQKPSSTFDMFTEFHQRTCGAGTEFGLSYESTTRNTSKSSFAGGRQSMNMDYQGFKAVQDKMGRGWLSPIYRGGWLPAAVLSGAVTAPGFYDSPGVDFWARHDWMAPGWPLGANPLQDVNASREAVKSGVSNPVAEASFYGRDAKKNLLITAKFQRLAKKLGVNLSIFEQPKSVQAAAADTAEAGAETMATGKEK